MNATGPIDENDKRRLVLRLLTRLQCAECRKPYNPYDFTLKYKMPDVWVLGVQCRHCGETAHVVVALQVVADSEPVIDLTPEEVETFGDRPPISSDDVLETHLLLEGLDSDLSLFAD